MSDLDKRAADALGPIPRIALTRAEAAAALGIKLKSFEHYVQPDIRLIRRGRLRLVPVDELRRWADQAAANTIEDMLASPTYVAPRGQDRRGRGPQGGTS